MGFLDSLRSLAGLRNAGDDRETEALIETLVVPAMPKIRAVSGYKRKLRDAVSISLAYARQLVDSLGEPVTIEPRLASRDPLVGAFFSSSEEANRVLAGAPAITDCFFLLVMVRRERKIVGSVREGEMIQRGVVQLSETFTDHEILAASSSLEETRRDLRRLIILDLSRKAAEDITEAHEARAELRTQKDNLKAELRTLELDSAISDRRAEAERAMASIRRELSRVEQDLTGVSPRLDSLDDYLEHVRHILANPQNSLSIEHISMRLNDFGIKVDTFPDEQGSNVSFIEVKGRLGRRAVLLACMRLEKARVR